MSAKAKETPEIEENMLVSWFEGRFGFLKPHLKMIGMVTGVLILACVIGAVLYQARAENYAAQWNQLHLADTNYGVDRDTDHYVSMADDIPDSQASLWALLKAGSEDLASGQDRLTNPSRYLNDEVEDLRADAVGMVEKAKTNLLRILESGNRRSKDLETRTVYCLARASETLGQWDDAKKYFEQLQDYAPGTTFAEDAEKGLARVTNPVLQAFYDNFRTSKVGVAPGVTLPENDLDISFPEMISDDDADPAPGDNENESPESNEGGDGESETPDPNSETENDSEPNIDESDSGEGESVAGDENETTGGDEEPTGGEEGTSGGDENEGDE